MVLAGVVAAGAGAVHAEDQAQPPQMSADQQAAMAEMMKLGQPGPEHAELAKMEGNFKAKVKMFMGPDAPAEESEGTLHNEMIMDGRYLHGSFKGQMMGTPFEGVSLVGYDNQKKKWTSLWIDNMSTAIMIMEGEEDASGKKVTYTGEFPCPVYGGAMTPFRQVFEWEDADNQRFEMYQTAPDGQEHKIMEIEYVREGK
jgi:hypothetical protein